MPDGLVHELAGQADDAEAALEALAGAVDAPAVDPVAVAPSAHRRTDGHGVAQAVAALLPERAIVSDEAQTSACSPRCGRRRDPATTGHASRAGPSARACRWRPGGGGLPGRRVIALQADGSALYTIRSSGPRPARASTSRR